MRDRHRKKGLVGFGFWLACWVLLGVLLCLKPKYPGGEDSLQNLRLFLFFGWVCGMFASFFYSSYHLAKAKGYPGAIALSGVIFPLAQPVVLIGLLVMREKHARGAHQRKLRSRHRSSLIEQIVRYRRNAVVGNVFGLVGIASGVLLVVFRWGIFADHDNEMVLGMFVFLAGYCGVISGCWWWLKAKNWPDAVVLIGLFPLAGLCIRYVRIVVYMIIRHNPASFALAMVVMPVMLVVVVAVLPDKSGWAQRQRWRIRERRVAPENIQGR